MIISITGSLWLIISNNIFVLAFCLSHTTFESCFHLKKWSEFDREGHSVKCMSYPHRPNGLICEMIKGNESLVEHSNLYFHTPLYHNFKMLHFDANPITIRYLITELWRICQCQIQHKTKEFKHCFWQYLKNNIAFLITSIGFILIQTP